GSSRSVDDYLRTEVIDPLPAGDSALLLGSSMLARLSGSACDAVLDRRGSGRVLVRLSRAGLLDDEGDSWYRLHPVLRSYFAAALAAQEPDVIPERHRRAAIWLEARGVVDEAVTHAFASGDTDLAASIVGRAIVPFHWAGRRGTARAWLQRFDDDAFTRRPWLAVDGAWQELSAGDVARMEHLADIAEHGTFEGAPPDGSPSFEMGRAMLRAAMCRRGPEDALANALRAVVLDRPGSRWRDLALWTVALARQALGDPAGADAALELAVGSAHANRNAGLGWSLLGHRALLAVDRQDWDGAQGFLREARGLATSTDAQTYASAAPVFAATARLEAHRGRTREATALLHQALVVRPSLTAAAPVLGVLSLLGLARSHLAVGDAPGAAVLLAQGRSILRARPQLGVLGAELTTLHESITTMPTVLLRGASSLTAAELRVLALLPYYLSFKEIGQRLGTKATTVKTHALSIYGKLGATTRSEAVELAIEAGLLDRHPG
ncbi:MAG TPA: LuxR C-terminal-related transcriptional regulator, partial [Candidatus Limnocylindrales bacterium]|nr:LuxR C-terminal-related transcriptional regulator [Candidatus Limnocylindrales bacterium]